MLSIEHPSHSVPDEVTVSIRKLREVELATQSRQDEISKLSRANGEERRLITEVRESAAESRGFNREMLQRLRDVRTKKFGRVKETLDHEAVIARPFDLAPWDFELPQPEPTDPTFWWARTDWWHSSRTPREPDDGSAANFSADSRGDGLHFFGGVTTHDGDLYKVAGRPNSSVIVTAMALYASR
jgi:hypothetical protein